MNSIRSYIGGWRDSRAFERGAGSMGVIIFFFSLIGSSFKTGQSHQDEAGVQSKLHCHNDSRVVNVVEASTSGISKSRRLPTLSK